MDDISKGDMKNGVVKGFFQCSISPSTIASHFNTSKQITNHPVDVAYEASLDFDYPFNTISTHVSMFCYPSMARLVYSKLGIPKANSHSFVITDQTGTRQYGYCLTIYKKLDNELKEEYLKACELWKSSTISESDLEYISHISEKLEHSETLLADAKMNGPKTRIEEMEEKKNLYQSLLVPFQKAFLKCENVYYPQCIGLMGTEPLYAFFRDWLVFVTRQFEISSSNIPLERYLTHLFHEIQFPIAEQSSELLVPMNSQITLTIPRPSVNQVKAPITLPYWIIIKALSLENIVTIFECIVLESKIIFSSAHLCLLNIAAEFFTSILFPLGWPHTYVPVLPCKLKDFIQAPVPYIIGIHPSITTEVPDDVILVDLDRDTVRCGQPIKSEISSREKRKLITRLQKYCQLDKFSTRTLVNVLLEDARDGWWTLKDEEEVSTQIKREFSSAMKKWSKTGKPHKSHDATIMANVSKELPKIPQEEVIRVESADNFSRSSSLTSFRSEATGNTDSHANLPVSSDHKLVRSPHIRVKKYFTAPNATTPPSPLLPPVHLKQLDTIYFFPLKVLENQTEMEEMAMFHSYLNIPSRKYKKFLPFADLALIRITCFALTKAISDRMGANTPNQPYQNEILIEGHRFHSCFAMAEVPNGIPSPQQKEPLCLGECAKCNGACSTKLLSFVQSVVTKDGVAFTTNYSNSDDPVTILQCAQCGLLVHETCISEKMDFCKSSLDPVGVHLSFLKFWASLLSNYRLNFVQEQEGGDPPFSTGRRMTFETALTKLKIIPAQNYMKNVHNLPTYDLKGFVESFALEQRLFISKVVATLAFTQLIHIASVDAEETRVFDKYISWRSGKSFFYANPEPLNDEQNQCLIIMKNVGVNEFGIDDHKWFGWPTKINTENFIPARIETFIRVDQQKSQSLNCGLSVSSSKNRIFSNQKKTQKGLLSGVFFRSQTFEAGSQLKQQQKSSKSDLNLTILKSKEVKTDEEKVDEKKNQAPPFELKNISFVLNDDEFAWYQKYEMFG